MSTLTPAGFALGCIPDEHDERDLLYSPRAEHTAYKFVDLEPDPATPPVWNQLQLGSCTAHGTLACFLFAAAKGGVSDPMLSRLMLYWLTRDIEGSTDTDSGGQIRDAIKATTKGIAPETDWPYDTAKFAERPPKKAFTAAKDNVDLEYARVDDSTDAIQACLSEGYPIDIGVTLYRSFESQDALASGITPMPSRADGSPIGGHCMAIWGIGLGADWITAGQFLTANHSTLYVKVRNSWGPEVYQSGYLLMPVAYMPKFGSDFWTIRKVS